MGKKHSSIQKAIEKSRLARSAATDHGKDSGKNPMAVTVGGVTRVSKPAFQPLHTAPIDRDVMEDCLFVSEVEDRSALAAYKICRTRVLQRMRSNNWHSIVVTSTGPGEGKTLTACNLALSVSWDVNQSVLLIDLDLQRSKVATYFGFNPKVENGIGKYLMGQAEISDIVYKPEGLQRISVIPSFGIVENSSDLLSGPRMKELLAWIRQQSDDTIVIFDMPPVLVDDDVLAFCPEVDAILLVVAQGKTDRSALEKATELLADANMLGVVLNRCDDKSSDNTYGYY